MRAAKFVLSSGDRLASCSTALVSLFRQQTVHGAWTCLPGTVVPTHRATAKESVPDVGNVTIVD